MQMSNFSYSRKYNFERRKYMREILLDASMLPGADPNVVNLSPEC